MAMTTAEPSAPFATTFRGRRSSRTQHESVSITRNGHDAAVVISPEDLAQLEETIAVLSDADALRDIREADAAYANGDACDDLSRRAQRCN